MPHQDKKIAVSGFWQKTPLLAQKCRGKRMFGSKIRGFADILALLRNMGGYAKIGQSEIRSQKSEDRSQKSEDRSRKRMAIRSVHLLTGEI
jgi:hypothetical protein